MRFHNKTAGDLHFTTTSKIVGEFSFLFKFVIHFEIWKTICTNYGYKRKSIKHSAIGSTLRHDAIACSTKYAQNPIPYEVRKGITLLFQFYS